MVVYFAFLWHIYQPPVQSHTVIKQIVNECYRPLLQLLRNHPDAHVCLNINGSLTEQLYEYGYNDILQALGELGANGQIDFTGSAKYHPILPLLPEPEVIRQIQINTETNRQFIGDSYQPRGFFPPEMAISDEIFPAIKNTGFDWIIASGIANSTPDFPTENVCSEYNTGLNIVFRDDYISVDCAFNKIGNIDELANRLKYKGNDQDYYVILAMDGETFGHHIKGKIENFLKPVFDALPNRQDIKMVSVSEIVDKFPHGPSEHPRSSSWSTMSYDLQRNVPFPLWLDPNNELHQQQQHFIMFALTAVNLSEKYRDSMNNDQRSLFDIARTFLDRGVHSCQQWWASKRPWYSPDMILRGLNEILLSVVNARRSIPQNAVDIKDALKMILEEMLKAQNKIILMLD
jgi:predicted glycosyl hydrolase (DUF1957 family)